MVGQIQSWFCMSTKDFTNNFKDRIIKFKRFSKLFSRTDLGRIPNFKRQMSSFISRCYWFRAVSSMTHSNSQAVWQLLKKWRNWRHIFIKWFIHRLLVNHLRMTYGSIQTKDFKTLLYNCTFVHLSPCIYPVKNKIKLWKVCKEEIVKNAYKMQEKKNYSNSNE